LLVKDVRAMARCSGGGSRFIARRTKAEASASPAALPRLPARLHGSHTLDQ
jgi:hypothetical protein